MSLFRRTIKEGDRVKCHIKYGIIDYWAEGVVTNYYPDYYLPDWLSHPNLLVEFDTPVRGEKSDVFKRGEVRLIKRK